MEFATIYGDNTKPAIKIMNHATADSQVALGTEYMLYDFYTVTIQYAYWF